MVNSALALYHYTIDNNIRKLGCITEGLKVEALKVEALCNAPQGALGHLQQNLPLVNYHLGMALLSVLFNDRNTNKSDRNTNKN